MGLLDAEKYSPERRTSGDSFGVKLREAVLAARRGECALCSLLAEQDLARVRWVAYDGLGGGPLRAKIRRARGLCRRHFDMLYRVAAEETFTLSGVADVLRDLLAADLEALREASASRRRKSRARRLTEAMAPSGTCPLCDSAAGAADRMIRDLLKEHGGATVFAAYLSSDGLLCRPHFLAAVERCDSEAAVDALVKKQTEAAETDYGELAEYLRKKDYRFADEAKGPEQDAPLRALRTHTGAWPD